MSSLFYFKLAFTNLKKNRKTYIPYLLTCIITIMMFYCLSAVAKNSGLDEMPGSASLKLILEYAVFITGVFAAVFLFYTNSFLIKQRKKEFGVYQVLGMDKRNLAKMEICETVITAVSALVLGLGLGMILGRLMFLILLKIVQFPVPLAYSVEPGALLQGLILFLGIFAAILISNLFQVGRANPIELLQGTNMGEKEPKTKWPLVLIGVATLGAGYYIALTTDNPLSAIPKFFAAVFLVIVGTYCLFVAGSVAFFKTLKKSKKFYYKTRHFTAVSGMIYRMKQNAVGLANICIMSTIVLVLVSTSVSLYAGIEDVVEVRYPTEFRTEIYQPDSETEKTAAKIVEEETEKAGVKTKNLLQYSSGGLACMIDDDNQVEIDPDKMEENPSSLVENYGQLTMIPVRDYNTMQGENAELDENQILVYTPSDKEYHARTLKLGDRTYQVKEILKDMKLERTNTSNIVKNIYVIMPDAASITDLLHRYGYEGAKEMDYNVLFDLEGEKTVCDSVMQAIKSRFTQAFGENALTDIRSEQSKDFYKIDGGFLFLGIFLGALFLMATVLIIYYKQISEGYSDKDRYQIMKKVGMDEREVRRSIKTQILLVFFLPLLTAVIHVAVAFHVMTQLLEIMYMVNIPLFLLCTGVTILVFAIFYALVFAVTSREYYRIVK